MFARVRILLCVVLVGWPLGARTQDWSPRQTAFLEKHCLECHDADLKKGGFDLEALPFKLDQRDAFEKWELVHDRVASGEMPPSKKKNRPRPEEIASFVTAISDRLRKADQARMATDGRSAMRRLNRFEFENALREVLAADWLQIADQLPEDGVAHLFNKSGERLDVSHVQITKFIEAAEYAVRTAVQAAAFPSKTKRFYARNEPVMQGYLRYRRLQSAATRAAIPLIGTTPQPEVIRGTQPVTVGEANLEVREQEAFGFVSGTYSATTKYDFTHMRSQVPIDGRYMVRMKTYTFLAGPNGRSGGDDHGLTGGRQAWWRPSRTEAFPGTRSEPVTLYALAESGDSRWLTTFDSMPEPTIIERDVYLKANEGIRPDASRLVRTRPGWKGNPNASREGIPGLALNWLELEGPVNKTWPPESYEALFGDMPFALSSSGAVKVQSNRPEEDARRLLEQFLRRAYRRPVQFHQAVEPFMDIFKEATRFQSDFTDAMITAFSAVLCSTDFLYLESTPGALSDAALAERLAAFLWNGVPDESLRRADGLSADPVALHQQTERLLEDARSDRFLDAFLDYWLDLLEIKTNTPDTRLYPDYYLDDLLTESSLLETRRFFRELIDRDLPSSHLVSSDFVFANERLAEHYDLPISEGVALKRIDLPPGSPRGGLLTQASVLRVTANGTTTTPVIRGAWVMERLMGLEIPPPPSGVSAIEPDIRGAKTIREQLDLHRASDSCHACHAKFDPAGFALESFDVAGGWRDRYRAMGDLGELAVGLGKNGHAFTFRHGPTVDCQGEMADGRAFKNVQELKQLLAEDERQLARNLLHQLIIFATGTPVRFSERDEVETILDRYQTRGYGVRSLIHGVVQSEMFRIK